MAKKKTIKNIEIKTPSADLSFRVQLIKEKDFFSITDIVKSFENGDQLLYGWLRNRNTVEFLGTWEKMYNPDFDMEAFEEFQKQAGLNNFTLSPKKWVEATNAVGMQSKAGRYGGGTFAHKDIALEFCSYLSPALRLYIIQEFQRLKEQEVETLNKERDWNLKRVLSKVNHHIHIDAVRSYLIPQRIIQAKKEGFVYASEADLLNVALFGITAKEWRLKNPDLRGNIRDHATAEQLLVLANLENLNAEYIHLGLDKEERLQRLNEVAIHQMGLLVQLPASQNIEKLK